MITPILKRVCASYLLSIPDSTISTFPQTPVLESMGIFTTLNLSPAGKIAIPIESKVTVSITCCLFSLYWSGFCCNHLHYQVDWAQRVVSLISASAFIEEFYVKKQILK